MKKTVLALAILGGFASAALAQSTVNIYGVVDAGLVLERGAAAGSVNKLSSGVASGSRLGFKGTEDLGGGLSALFLLENGFDVSTGVATQGGALFGRQAYVGLGSGFGTVTLGRQYTPEYLVLAFADPFGTGLAGHAGNLFAITGNAASRMDNTIKYVTPNLSGFTGELAYGFGEVAGDNSAGRQIGAAVGYTGGPLSVRLGYHNWDRTVASPTAQDTKNTLLAATYNFDVVKVHAAFATNKGFESSKPRNPLTGAGSNPLGGAAPIASTDSRDAMIGVTVPMGQHTILASYITKNDKTSNNQDADQWAIGYRYALSKRTDFYAAYARIKNDNGADYTVGSAVDPGTGDKAFNLGIRHTF